MNEVIEKEFLHKNLILAETAEIGSFMANRLGMSPNDTAVMVDPLAIASDGIPDAENIYAVYSLPDEVVCEPVMHMLNYLESYGYNVANITYL